MVTFHSISLCFLFLYVIPTLKLDYILSRPTKIFPSTTALWILCAVIFICRFYYTPYRFKDCSCSSKIFSKTICSWSLLNSLDISNNAININKFIGLYLIFLYFLFPHYFCTYSTRIVILRTTHILRISRKRMAAIFTRIVTSFWNLYTVYTLNKKHAYVKFYADIFLRYWFMICFF